LIQIQVLVRHNNIEYALKALKRKMQREGVFYRLRVSRFYEKPSAMKARKLGEAIKRRKRARHGGGDRSRAV